MRCNHKYIGIGGRLDTIQAAILSSKLKYFSKELKNRKKNCTSLFKKVYQIIFITNSSNKATEN